MEVVTQTDESPHGVIASSLQLFSNLVLQYPLSNRHNLLAAYRNHFR